MADPASGTAAGLEQVRAAQDQLRRYQEVLASLESAEYSGTDPSGTVTVTVDGNGTVADVTVSARAIRDLSYTEIGPAVLAALGVARGQSTAAFAERFAEISGTPVEPPPETSYDPLSGGLLPGMEQLR